MKKKSSKHKLICQSLSTAILHNWNRDRCHSEKTCVISGLVFSPIKYQTMPCRWQTAYGWFPPSPNFYLRTCVNFTQVNNIEAMYESLCVNVKVERGFSFLRSRTTFHPLPLYHLHTQNYTIDTTKVPKLGKSKSVQSRTKSIRIWFAHASMLSRLKKLSWAW